MSFHSGTLHHYTGEKSGGGKKERETRNANVKRIKNTPLLTRPRITQGVVRRSPLRFSSFYFFLFFLYGQKAGQVSTHTNTQQTSMCNIGEAIFINTFHPPATQSAVKSDLLTLQYFPACRKFRFITFQLSHIQLASINNNVFRKLIKMEN